MLNRQIVLCLSAVALLVAASAFAVVHNSYKSRQLFIELNKLNQDFTRMRVEFGRLQLEQGTWSSPAMVERLAVDELGMRVPLNSQVIMVSSLANQDLPKTMLAAAPSEPVPTYVLEQLH